MGERAEAREFRCARCGFECLADYVGRTPPWNPHIVFLEDGFVIRDPNDASGHHPVFVGGHCCACVALVCAMPACSLFFAKRICVECARTPEVRRQLPPEVLASLPKEPD